jgi:hypothetical protein
VPTMLVNFMMAEWMDGSLGRRRRRREDLWFTLPVGSEETKRGIRWMSACVRIQSDAPRSSTDVVSLPDVPDAAGASSSESNETRPYLLSRAWKSEKEEKEEEETRG